MSSTRRGVLTALGVSLVSAGCLSGSTDRSDDTDGTSPTPDGGRRGTGSPTPTPTPDGDRHDTGGSSSTPTPTPDDGRRVSMGTTVTVDGTSVTVENPRVRKAVVTPGMAHTRVVANAGQFVVVDLTVDGAAADRYFDRDFRSSVGGKTLQGSDPLPTTTERGYAFAFPATRHERATIRWQTGESAVHWTLPESVLETLAVEPRFVVTDLGVRRRNGELALELSVSNEGDRDGRFAARVSFDGYSGGSIVEFPVPAGESKGYVGSPGKVLLYFENHGGETLTVRYPADDGLATVERTVNTPETTADEVDSPALETWL